MNKSGTMVTIRIPQEEYAEVYLPFKELVTRELGSDVCYTTVALYRAFLVAMKQIPPSLDQTEIKFLRQNVQINMGCTFNYEVKKRRRAGETHFPEEIITDKNNLLPKIVDAYPELSSKSQAFWIEELSRQGWRLEPPSVSTATHGSRITKFFKRVWSIVKQLFFWWRS